MTDSQIILSELQKLGRESDPRNAGLETWELLMGMIGRGNKVSMYETGDNGAFDDLMLREWAHEYLVFSDGPGADPERDNQGPDNGVNGSRTEDSLLELDDIDNMISGLQKYSNTDTRLLDVPVCPGSLLRASAAVRSPFLLQDQEFHKSIILVLQEDETVSVGVLLNLPSTYDIELGVPSMGALTMTQRYGGRYGVREQSGDKPFVWLHFNDSLRNAKVGSPIAGRLENVWMCTEEDAGAAIAVGLATPDDFIVVNGFSVWKKEAGGMAGGIRGEVLGGRFEVVAPERMPSVWEVLRKQRLLSVKTMDVNISLIDQAWKMGAAILSDEGASSCSRGGVPTSSKAIPEGSELAHKSRMSLGELADLALRSWIATFLLGDPDLRGIIED